MGKFGRIKTSKKCIEYRSRKIWIQFFRRALGYRYFSVGFSWINERKELAFDLGVWQLNIFFLLWQRNNHVRKTKKA